MGGKNLLTKRLHTLILLPAVPTVLRTTTRNPQAGLRMACLGILIKVSLVSVLQKFCSWAMDNVIYASSTPIKINKPVKFQHLRLQLRRSKKINSAAEKFYNSPEAWKSKILGYLETSTIQRQFQKVKNCKHFPCHCFLEYIQIYPKTETHLTQGSHNKQIKSLSITRISQFCQPFGGNKNKLLLAECLHQLHFLMLSSLFMSQFKTKILR